MKASLCSTVAALAMPSALSMLSILASACNSGRPFHEPSALSEFRPERKSSPPASLLDDDRFRATPPERLSVKRHASTAPTEARLSNGVHVVMLERHQFPSISAIMILDRGAAAAGPGVANLYSDALLGSSAEYTEAEAWKYLSFVGASVRSDAWFDAVGLQVTALTPLFSSAISRAAPMFTSPLLDGDTLDEMRTQETADDERATTTPAAVASDALYEAVFSSSHPYATPIVGRHEAAGTKKGLVGKLVPPTDAAVRTFRDGNISADHVSVACVGDFKPEALLRTLEKALGKLPKRASVPAPAMPPVATQGGAKILVIDRPGAAQSAVAIGWPGPRASDPDLVTLDVLAAATGGDLSTRLNITVRKELGATYGVQMAATGLREAGLVRISAAIDTTRTIVALKGLFGEIERLRTEPLSGAELSTAKLRSIQDLEHGSTKSLARHLAHALAEGLPPAHVLTRNARIDIVSTEMVRAAAERYLTPAAMRVVIVGDAAKLMDGLRSLPGFEVTTAKAK